MIVGICWAVIGDPAITFLAKAIVPREQDLFRSLNDFIFVVIIAWVLFLLIDKSQRVLMRSEEEYRQLFESNPNPMWIYDTETLRFIKVNHAAVEKYAFSQAQFLKMTIYDIRPVEEQDALRNALKNNSDTLRRAGIWKHRKGTGEIINVSVVSHPVVFHNNKHCKMVLATDMTAFINKEKELQDSLEKIKAYNETLIRVAWSNSHELRKPVCSILGLVAILKDAKDRQEIKDAIKLLEKCSTELDRVTRDNNEILSKIKLDDITFLN